MLSAARQMVRDCGWLATSLYALDRLLRKLRCGRIHFYRLERQPVPSSPLLPAHRGRQFEIRELRSGDAALAQIPRPRAIIEIRFAQGSVGFGAFRDGELVG